MKYIEYRLVLRRDFVDICSISTSNKNIKPTNAQRFYEFLSDLKYTVITLPKHIYDGYLFLLAKHFSQENHCRTNNWV